LDFLCVETDEGCVENRQNRQTDPKPQSNVTSFVLSAVAQCVGVWPSYLLSASHRIFFSRSSGERVCESRRCRRICDLRCNPLVGRNQINKGGFPIGPNSSGFLAARGWTERTRQHFDPTLAHSLSEPTPQTQTKKITRVRREPKPYPPVSGCEHMPLPCATRA
jgi:hypothetical protein